MLLINSRNIQIKKTLISIAIWGVVIPSSLLWPSNKAKADEWINPNPNFEVSIPEYPARIRVIGPRGVDVDIQVFDDYEDYYDGYIYEEVDTNGFFSKHVAEFGEGEQGDFIIVVSCNTDPCWEHNIRAIHLWDHNEHYPHQYDDYR